MTTTIAQLKQARAAHAGTIKELKALAKKKETGSMTDQEADRFDALMKRASMQAETRDALLDGIEMEGAQGAGNDAAASPRGGNMMTALQLPEAGFNNFGDFAGTVRRHEMGRKTGATVDQRIAPLAAAPSTFSGEGSGADGGILVPPGYSAAIFSMAAVLAEPSLVELTDSEPVRGNAMFFPRDTATPWDSAGVQVNWVAEGKAATPSKPVLAGSELRLKKIMGLVPMANELSSDAPMPANWLGSTLAIKAAWSIGESILFGSGAGQPLGCLNSGAAIVVAKDAGQLTATLSATNLANMISRLPPGSMRRARWLISPTAMPAMITLTLGNYPVWRQLNSNGEPFADAPGGKLLGLPITWTQHCPAFGSQGDIALADLSYYQAITKAEGFQTATSAHLYFDADVTAFRIVFRIDGAPKLTAPITPPKSSVTLSPFILLGAR